MIDEPRHRRLHHLRLPAADYGGNPGLRGRLCSGVVLTMAEINFEFNNDNFDELDLSKEIVAAVSDLPTLLGWYKTLCDKSIEMREFVAAFKFAGISDDDWFRRTAGKIGFCGVGMRWVEQRILELGGEPPYPLADPRNKQITELTRQIKRLTGKTVVDPEGLAA